MVAPGTPIKKTLGTYTLIDPPIGEGGMSKVYKATNANGDIVAIKVIQPASNNEVMERFAREVPALFALKSHPHIVSIIDANMETETPYIVMEYLNGKTLDRVVPEKGLPVAKILS